MTVIQLDAKSPHRKNLKVHSNVLVIDYENKTISVDVDVDFISLENGEPIRESVFHVIKYNKPIECVGAYKVEYEEGGYTYIVDVNNGDLSVQQHKKAKAREVVAAIQKMIA